MDSDIPVFKPVYPLPFRLGFLALPTLFLGLFCGGISSPALVPRFYWYLALACGVATSLLPFFFIREIRFVNDMVIRRHFLPDVFVDYKAAFAIEPGFIRASNRSVRTGPLQNIDVLQEMVKHWTAKQTLKAATRGRDSLGLIFPHRGFGTYGGFWGLVLGIIVVVLQPTWLPIDPRWLPGAAFIAVYFAFVYVIPRYL